MMSEKDKKATILYVDNDRIFCEPLLWRLKAEGLLTSWHGERDICKRECVVMGVLS